MKIIIIVYIYEYNNTLIIITLIRLNINLDIYSPLLIKLLNINLIKKKRLRTTDALI
jgi:hypothetical protein